MWSRGYSSAETIQACLIRPRDSVLENTPPPPPTQKMKNIAINAMMWCLFFLTVSYWPWKARGERVTRCSQFSVGLSTPKPPEIASLLKAWKLRVLKVNSGCSNQEACFNNEMTLKKKHAKILNTSPSNIECRMTGCFRSFYRNSDYKCGSAGGRNYKNELLNQDSWIMYIKGKVSTRFHHAFVL